MHLTDFLPAVWAAACRELCFPGSLSTPDPRGIWQGGAFCQVWKRGEGPSWPLRCPAHRVRPTGLCSCKMGTELFGSCAFCFGKRWPRSPSGGGSRRGATTQPGWRSGRAPAPVPHRACDLRRSAARCLGLAANCCAKCVCPSLLPPSFLSLCPFPCQQFVTATQ